MEVITNNLENSKTFELPYPNDKIKPCGTHFNNRECKDSLRISKDDKPIIIRFVPSGFKSQDSYLSDNGNVYGTNNNPYGWGRDMKGLIRQRLNTSSPLLETFVEFPPAQSSRPCNKIRLDNLCEPVSWFIKVGKGRFRVKLFIGDALRQRRINLKINNKSIVKSTIIDKNMLQSYEEVFESYKELLEITSDCEENCEDAISILNAIEISQFDEAQNNIITSREKETSCGLSYTGGRCDIGPDVLHCLFDDPSKQSVKFCNGELLSLVTIPSGYYCKEQVGKLKCVNVS
jgi:hypothetical protein